MAIPEHEGGDGHGSAYGANDHHHHGQHPGDIRDGVLIHRRLLLGHSTSRLNAN